MPVIVACPTCLQKVRVPDSVLGKQIKCPQCKNPFVAGDSSAPPTAASRTAASRAGGSSAASAVAEPAVAAEPPSKGWSNPEIDVVEDEFDTRSALRPRPEGNGFADFLLLKTFVAPRIQVALFYIGLVAILVFGLVSLVAAIFLALRAGLERTMGLLLLIATVLATPLAVVVWRVFCEMVAAVFRAHEAKEAPSR